MTRTRTTSPEDEFNTSLDRRVRGGDDLQWFASRLESVANRRVPEDTRAAMWLTVLAAQPASRSGASGAGPISQPSPRARQNHWNGIVPAGLPAPAVLFLGVLLAIVFAFSGFGNDGGDIVTPTVRAEHAATAIATPDAAVPTFATVKP